MEKVFDKNWDWKLIAEENGIQTFSNSIPNEAISNILKIIVIMNQKETQPDECIVDLLEKILEKKITVSQLTIAQLTGLNKDYLKDLLSGNLKPADTQGVILLTILVSKLAQLI